MQPPQHLRVIAWPGWLDNAGSFDSLAPLLARDGFTVVAVDPPGCGRSSHLPPTSGYSTEHEAMHLAEIVEVLGWADGAVLLAHSRGGNVCLRVAATFPGYVRGLALLENNLGYSESFSPSKIAAMLTTEEHNRARRPRRFPSAAAAVHKSYHNRSFPKSWATARNITRRHLAPIPSTNAVRSSSPATPPLSFSPSLSPPSAVVVENEMETVYTRAGAEDLEQQTQQWQKLDMELRGACVFSHDVRTYGERQALSTTPLMNLQLVAQVQCPVYMLTSELNQWRTLEERTTGAVIREKKALLAEGQLTEVVVMGEHHHVHSDNPSATYFGQDADDGLQAWLKRLAPAEEEPQGLGLSRL